MFSGYGGYNNNRGNPGRRGQTQGRQGMPVQGRQGMPMNRPQGMMPASRPQGMAQNPMQMQGQGQGQGQQMGQRMATPEEMGITFEPVESIFGVQPQSQNPSPQSTQNTQSTPPVPDAKPAGFDIGKVGEFVQNERNGAMFYEHLAAVCPSPGAGKNLMEIAETCRKNSSLFGKMYKNAAGKDYSVKDTQIDTSVGFHKGVKWAVREEGLALREIAEIYGQSGGDAALLAALTGKIGCLGVLLGLA